MGDQQNPSTTLRFEKLLQHPLNPHNTSFPGVVFDVSSERKTLRVFPTQCLFGLDESHQWRRLIAKRRFSQPGGT